MEETKEKRRKNEMLPMKEKQLKNDRPTDQTDHRETKLSPRTVVGVFSGFESLQPHQTISQEERRSAYT